MTPGSRRGSMSASFLLFAGLLGGCARTDRDVASRTTYQTTGTRTDEQRELRGYVDDLNASAAIADAPVSLAVVGVRRALEKGDGRTMAVTIDQIRQERGAPISPGAHAPMDPAASADAALTLGDLPDPEIPLDPWAQTETTAGAHTGSESATDSGAGDEPSPVSLPKDSDAIADETPVEMPDSESMNSDEDEDIEGHRVSGSEGSEGSEGAATSEPVDAISPWHQSSPPPVPSPAGTKRQRNPVWQERGKFK